MKSPAEVLTDVERRLTTRWAQIVGEQADWDPRFSLGSVSATELGASFPAIAAQARGWDVWAREHDVELVRAVRRLPGTDQVLPTHLVVADVDVAARLCGGRWPAHLARARARAAALQGAPVSAAERVGLLRATQAYSDVDFDLLMRAAAWFAAHPGGAGLTPRQVPVPGMHAKWLNTHQDVVRRLAGVADLGLLPAHPPRVHLTYLDPGHRAAGGRWRECVTVGDRVRLAYEPVTVVISENKDTAVWFPPLPGGVAVEGEGRGASAVAALEWVRTAPRLFYWGDMDVHGLEILEEFRAAGLAVTSVLMDVDAFDTWSAFGTAVDRRGKELGPSTVRPTPHLSAGERALYERLCSPAWDGFRRVEQERIPLHVAAALVAVS